MMTLCVCWGIICLVFFFKSIRRGFIAQHNAQNLWTAATRNVKKRHGVLLARTHLQHHTVQSPHATRHRRKISQSGKNGQHPSAIKLQLDRHHDKLTNLFESMSTGRLGPPSPPAAGPLRHFHRAITHELRLDASSSTVDALFTHADTHGDGAVDFRTLGKALDAHHLAAHYDGAGYTSPSPDTSDRRHSSLLSTVSSTQTESGTIPKTEVSTQTDTLATSSSSRPATEPNGRRGPSRPSGARQQRSSL